MILHAIENQIFRKAAPQAIKYLAKPDLRTRHSVARKIFAQAAREFQVAPPITLHISDPDLMAGVWCATRESYVVNAKDRARREAVAAAVSELNQCPYCVDVHSAMFAATGADPAELLQPESLAPEIAAVHRWASATLAPDSEDLRFSTISAADIPQIFGTALMYHYLNRVVGVFLMQSPVALPGMGSVIGRKVAQKAFAILGRRITQIDPQAGQCAVQIEADLPAEFRWAGDGSAVAGGLAHFAQAAENAGKESVSEDVRAVVTAHLKNWNGEQVPLSREWLKNAIAPLQQSNRPAARLALLSARAPWQVDADLIRSFRNSASEKASENSVPDRLLLQTVAWASFAAARRIASWFPTAAA